MAIPKKTDENETTRATFERWLSDGSTWIGVFENKDLSHPEVGRRIAVPYDDSLLDQVRVGATRGPDGWDTRGVSHGPGWRYILVAVERTADAALRALESGAR